MKVEEIEKSLNKINLNLIYKKDYKTHEKVDVIDELGYKYSVSLKNLLNNGFNSSIISNFNKPEYNLYNLRLYLKLHDIKLEVIGEPIITSGKNKIKFLCSCNNEFEAIIHEVIGVKNKHQCNECGVYSRFNNRRHDFWYYKKQIELYGFVLLDNYFKVKNIKQKFNIEDKEGYRYNVEMSSITNSNKLLKFYETNPHTIYNIKKYIDDNNINVELLSDTYVDSLTPLTFKCECGNIYKTTLGRFLRQSQHRCSDCSGVKSNLEYLIEKELLDANVEYVYQYCIEDCRVINILPFDFAIFKDNKLEFLIEVQGRQHYEIVRHSKEETFEILQQKLKTTQSHDNIKEGYCKCNNIKLIKIPYWNIKNNKYKEIINTLIHNI